MVTLVVLNFNDAKTTEEYIQSIRNYECFDHIVIVDNCSNDNSYEQLSKLETNKVKLIRTEKNGGYGYGNNFGIKYANDNYNSDIVLITNPDVRYEEGVVNRLEEVLRSDENISIAAPKMTVPNGKVDMHTAWKIPSGWQYLLGNSSVFNRFCEDFFYKDLIFSDGIMSVGTVAGSMLMMKTADFYKSGCYDENIFLFCEENVLGMKIHQIGKKIVLVDENFVHFHSVSIKKNIKSFSRREKIMWNSRRYVLKTYYSFTTPQMACALMLQYFTIILRSIVHIIK